MLMGRILPITSEIIKEEEEEEGGGDMMFLMSEEGIWFCFCAWIFASAGDGVDSGSGGMMKLSDRRRWEVNLSRKPRVGRDGDGELERGFLDADDKDGRVAREVRIAV